MTTPNPRKGTYFIDNGFRCYWLKPIQGFGVKKIQQEIFYRI
jgi:hypothetical protein